MVLYTLIRIFPLHKTLVKIQSKNLVQKNLAKNLIGLSTSSVVCLFNRESFREVLGMSLTCFFSYIFRTMCRTIVQGKLINNQFEPFVKAFLRP